MYWVTGTCDRLATPDGNQTAACNKAVGLVSYSNGRRSFWFSIPHKSLIAFSGISESQDDKAGTLHIDLITLASSPHANPSVAKGSCSFDNPWKGRAHIRCQGSTEAGNFSRRARAANNQYTIRGR